MLDIFCSQFISPTASVDLKLPASFTEEVNPHLAKRPLLPTQELLLVK